MRRRHGEGHGLTRELIEDALVMFVSGIVHDSSITWRSITTTALYDGPLVFMERPQKIVADVKMLTDQIGWEQRQPLVQRDIGITIAAEHFEKAQRCVAGVLNVMAHRKRHIPDIARLHVKRSGFCIGRKNGHASLSRDVVLPLVRSRVPV